MRVHTFICNSFLMTTTLSPTTVSVKREKNKWQRTSCWATPTNWIIFCNLYRTAGAVIRQYWSDSADGYIWLLRHQNGEVLSSLASFRWSVNLSGSCLLLHKTIWAKFVTIQTDFSAISARGSPFPQLSILWIKWHLQSDVWLTIFIGE